MYIRVLFILLCSWCSAELCAQPLKDPAFYYAHPAVSQDAKDLYSKVFDVNSSPKSYSILDSAFTQNDDTRPFYIYLVCVMLSKAEGELRAELNIICRYLAEQRPDDLTDVLFSRSSLISSSFKEEWAHRVSVELRITCSTDPMFCFKKSRNEALSNCDVAHKSKLELLYNYVRRDMKLFQQNQ